MRRRPARPLLLIDLALPRDVESAAADLQNVFLYNLDDLARIAETNRSAREAEIGRCRAILAQRADSLWDQVLRHSVQASEPSAGHAGRNTGTAGQAAAP
jgi:glutamyl-tRNA reductase